MTRLHMKTDRIEGRVEGPRPLRTAQHQQAYQTLENIPFTAKTNVHFYASELSLRLQVDVHKEGKQYNMFLLYQEMSLWLQVQFYT